MTAAVSGILYIKGTNLAEDIVSMLKIEENLRFS